MLGRFFEARIRRVRETVAGLLSGLDDRSRLLALELGSEARWLGTVAALGLAAVIVVIICLVWLMASVVALAWDTPWRLHALGGAAGFWLLLSLGLLLKVRALLRRSTPPLPLSRKVFADDIQSLRGEIDHE
ncbi:MAG: phage holin family protein [Lautropia sp.]|nr:phage holin family protein [Lautropia sp.]